MGMPTFIIIGAPRAGTTSIYYYLKQHPEIFMSPTKETNLFEYKANGKTQIACHKREKRYPIRNLESYQALFQGVSTEKAVGEASPGYLAHPQTPAQIHRYLPNIKLIGILRNPAERAYSSYLHHFRRNMESGSFSQAIRDEDQGVREGQGYRERKYISTGFYFKHLSRYLEFFDRSQMGIYLFEDLKNNDEGLMQKIFRHLVVDDRFIPDMSVRYNVSGIPKNNMLNSLLSPGHTTAMLKRILPDVILKPVYRYFMNTKNRNLDRPVLSPEMRQELIGKYRSDILRLEPLIERDLSMWLA